MPSSLAHYAVGAAGLQAFDLPRRRLALLGLWSVVPDLDVAPAVAWTLSAPHLPLGADALRTGARLLGHRGFSHTFLAALLAGLLVWGLTRRRQEALVVGFLWSLHVVLDTLTDWTTIPFWPLSEQTYMLPLVTGLDPILTLLSLGTIVALLGPIAADKLGWPGHRKRARFERWGRRWGRPLAYGSVAAVAFSGVMVGWTAAATDAGQVLPANAPRTAALDRPVDAEVEVWNVTTRWTPVAEGETRRVPYVANGTAAPPGVVDRAECALASMGPFAPVERPFWELSREGDRWIAQGRDLVRNATGTGGPQVRIAVAEDGVEAAWVTGSDPDQGEPFYRTTIPNPLWEDAPCL